MRKITIKTILLVVLLAISIFEISLALSKLQARKHFSQNPMDPVTLPPATLSQELADLTPENIQNLQEVLLFQQNMHKEFIAISEIEENRNILGITKDGFLYQFKAMPSSLDSYSVVNVTYLDKGNTSEIPSYRISAGISFSRNGEFVIVPNELNDNGIYGLSVWNTESLKLTDCMGKERFCPGWGPSDDSFTSLVLHPLRNLYLAAFKSTLTGWYKFDNEDGDGFERFNGGVRENLAITRLAIDFHGDYLAIADSGGTIQLLDISGYQREARNIPSVFSYEIDPNSSFLHRKESNTVVDLEFDDTHSWLGWLTNEELIVWGLQSYFVPLKFKTDTNNGNAIAFDRTGRYLAVAAQDGIKIYNPETGFQIASYPVGEVTAIYFSRDNRLLIWGDVDGNIHLWGVKE